MKLSRRLFGRSGRERTSGITTADRKALARFLVCVRKRGGAVATEEVESLDPVWRQAAERAFNEHLVRGHNRRGGQGYAFAQWAELHLTTTGEKFAKDWSRRWLPARPREPWTATLRHRFTRRPRTAALSRYRHCSLPALTRTRRRRTATTRTISTRRLCTWLLATATSRRRGRYWLLAPTPTRKVGQATHLALRRGGECGVDRCVACCWCRSESCSKRGETPAPPSGDGAG